MRTDLLDLDGENRALRSFLAQYSCNDSITVGDMARHMRNSGWGEECIPPFAANAGARLCHLTKSGAQIWIRQLLALEAA